MKQQLLSLLYYHHASMVILAIASIILSLYCIYKMVRLTLKKFRQTMEKQLMSEETANKSDAAKKVFKKIIIYTAFNAAMIFWLTLSLQALAYASLPKEAYLEKTDVYENIDKYSHTTSRSLLSGPRSKLIFTAFKNGMSGTYDHYYYATEDTTGQEHVQIATRHNDKADTKFEKAAFKAYCNNHHSNQVIYYQNKN